MQVFLILISDYFTVFQLLKLFSYIELTLLSNITGTIKAIPKLFPLITSIRIIGITQMPRRPKIIKKKN